MKFLFMLILLINILSCKSQNGSQEQIMVFAGMGMKSAVTEIIDSFHVEYPHIQVVNNWAASGVLARQMSQGQIPDVFISANKKWIHYVDSLGLVVDHKIMSVAKNELVLIANKNASLDTVHFNEKIDFDMILKDGILSIGDPAYVPVGTYTKQSLQYYGLFSSVESRLMPARDVRSALWVVELGEAPAGIVFRSEAMTSDKVKILSVIPSESHKPINFVAAQCKSRESANLFYQFLATEKARNLWIKYGFY